ncbi:hypothetical protein [Reyranella sp.]|uniref:hypothetical protein n=1 Tax=Reyranella sp. TaxID=1929291 RepID=UPI003D10C323
MSFDFEGEVVMASLPDSSPIYAIVGRIASRWGKLEWEVDRLSWLLAGLRRDEPGACMTAQILGIHNKLRALISLARLNEAPQSIIDDLNKFSNEAIPITMKRNRAVHDSWWMGAKTKKVGQLRLTADKRLDYRWKEITEEEMIGIESDVKKLAQKFFKIDMAIHIFWKQRKRVRRKASPKRPA